MFDFGFWELAIIMVVALLVIGPERLPILAGQAGRFIGKAKRIINSLRVDIESEIKAAELKDILDKQQNEIGELKEIIKESQNEIEHDYDKQVADSGLTKAVEEQIESTKQQELTLRSDSQKNETD